MGAEVGARRGTRTPDLLVVSHTGLNGVLTWDYAGNGGVKRANLSAVIGVLLQQLLQPVSVAPQPSLQILKLTDECHGALPVQPSRPWRQHRQGPPEVLKLVVTVHQSKRKYGL